MKTKLFICAFILTAIVVTAQNDEKKTATVRIKKVENINGVEKITDTTYTTNDADKIISGDKLMEIKTEDIKNENGMVIKTIMINDQDGKGESTIKVSTGDSKKDAEIEKALKSGEKNGQPLKQIMIVDNGGKSGSSEIKIVEGDKINEAEVKKLLEDSGVDPNDCKGKKTGKIVIVDQNSQSSSENKQEKTVTKVIILKMNITNASDEDVKRLKDQLGNADNKVEMESMKLYPNPNDGRFNLNFNLKNKGDAEISIYNSDGKQVYNEKLPNFTGEYNKPIDISDNNKGIYFVKIRQGEHSQVKKISMD